MDYDREKRDTFGENLYKPLARRRDNSAIHEQAGEKMDEK